MKIACTDNSAARRTSLARQVEKILEDTRALFGHINLFSVYPVARSDFNETNKPDLILIGSGYSIEDSMICCRELSRNYPETSLAAIVNQDNYNLSTLKKFHNFRAEVFIEREDQTRLLHYIALIKSNKSNKQRGKIAFVNSPKGGVGCTTLVTSLCHATQALGYEAICIDLSSQNLLTRYLQIPRTCSAEFAAVIRDDISPDEQMIENCIEIATNGIPVFLSPGTERSTREMWIRDEKCLDNILAIYESLKDKFDLIFVDASHAEGLLPYALSVRANTRLLLTANDAVSCHLIFCEIDQIEKTLHSGKNFLIFNELHDNGLSIRSFQKALSKQGCNLIDGICRIPQDLAGHFWIGTGNSFYTESSKSTQSALESLANTIYNDTPHLESNNKKLKFNWTSIKEKYLRLLSKENTTRENLAIPGDIMSHVKAIENHNPVQLDYMDPDFDSPQSIINETMGENQGSDLPDART